MYNTPSSKSHGAPVACPKDGKLEGNVNASVICLHRTVEAMLFAMGLEMPPIYDESDYELFIDAVKKHNPGIEL